jgi:hypothetical protein
VTARLNVLIPREAGCSEIDQSSGIRTCRERVEQHAFLVGTAQLPSSKRYQHRDEDKGEQRREQSWREDAGTHFD